MPFSSDTRRLNGAEHQHPPTAAATMLKIQSLLNPVSDTSALFASSGTRVPPRPTYPPYISTPAETPRPETAPPSPPKRQKMAKDKLIKDGAVFTRGPRIEPVNYEPYECSLTNDHLTSEQSQELNRQHRRYQLYPSALDNDKISDYTRHIPYSSEKKTFLHKTGRDAFEVSQYTFVVPGDAEQRKHVVMWDYQIGLVRVTPFFKALKHTKTTPAKSIKQNPGLTELAHSITGGAIAAQGYWIPYECARAICLTFCYNIRWALTPVFGPSFVNECVRPSDPNYNRFKIDPQLVYNATREAEGRLVDGVSRSATPAEYNGHQEIPRSVPASFVAGKDLRPRKEKKPSFTTSSPFASESDASARHYSHKLPAPGSPDLSPKSSHREVGWTSINTNSHGNTTSPPHAPSGSLTLLTEPRDAPVVSWGGVEPAEPAQEVIEMDDRVDSRNAERLADAARSPAILDDSGSDFAVESSGSSSGSESDDLDIALSPSTKRKSSTRSLGVHRPTATSTKASTKFNTADMRAAQLLMSLAAADAELAPTSRSNSTNGGLKRKADLM